MCVCVCGCWRVGEVRVGVGNKSKIVSQKGATTRARGAQRQKACRRRPKSCPAPESCPTNALHRVDLVLHIPGLEIGGRRRGGADLENDTRSCCTMRS